MVHYTRCSFVNWANTASFHGKPFFPWLEYQPIGLADDKATIAAAKDLSYVRSHRRASQAPPGLDKRKLLSFSPSIMANVLTVDAKEGKATRPEFRVEKPSRLLITRPKSTSLNGAVGHFELPQPFEQTQVGTTCGLTRS